MIQIFGDHSRNQGKEGRSKKYLMVFMTSCMQFKNKNKKMDRVLKDEKTGCGSKDKCTR